MKTKTHIKKIKPAARPKAEAHGEKPAVLARPGKGCAPVDGT